MSRRPLFLLITTLLLFPEATEAQDAPPPVPRAAASTRATVEVLLDGRWIAGRWFAQAPSLAGPARIAVDYGQPHARGREIVGGVVPYGEVWRAGANLATHLTTDVDLVLGESLTLPRGRYTLFVLPAEGDWQLIVNRQVGQWGTDHEPGMDVGRVPLRVRHLAEPQESFSVWLVPLSPQPAGVPASGVLRMAWGEAEMAVDWRVSWP
jgi:hypothetical protein